MNEAESNQQLIQFNAKKDLYELNIEVNELGRVVRVLRGDNALKICSTINYAIMPLCTDF